MQNLLYDINILIVILLDFKNKLNLYKTFKKYKIVLY